MSDVASTTKSPQQSIDAGNTMPEGQQVSNSLVRPDVTLKAGSDSPKQVQPYAPGALRRQMDSLFVVCPIVDQAFLDVIHAASTAERQEILNSERYREAIRVNISGHLAMVVVSALMEGSQSWLNPIDNDFYNYFCVNNGSGTLPNTATMNCWESIMYAAFLAGQTTAAFIRRFYSTALSSASPNTAIWTQLGFSTSLPRYPATTPTAGQWVFYLPAGESVPSHIALSQGGDLATSLWNQPNFISSVQRIRINDLATPGGRIFIGRPILR